MVATMMEARLASTEVRASRKNLQDTARCSDVTHLTLKKIMGPEPQSWIASRRARLSQVAGCVIVM